MVVVRVPGSSANLGPGLDVLGLALGVHAEATTEGPLDDREPVDRHHPAAIAFTEAGGRGDLWVRSVIPMGRGLGYSGAVRVAGAAAAILQQGTDATTDATIDRDGRLSDAAAASLVEFTARLEGHADNVAASVYGGLVAVVDAQVHRVPVALEPAVVVWVPTRTTTSTNRSRAALADTVPIGDAVANLGRLAVLLSALGSGDVAALAAATEDRLHQPRRLALVPDSARALELGLELGAWCGWLSGSGPSVAFLVAPTAAPALASGLDARLGEVGHTKVLALDRVGTRVVGDR